MNGKCLSWTIMANFATLAGHVTIEDEELPADPEVEYLLQFIESSKRGIGFSQPNRPVKSDM